MTWFKRNLPPIPKINDDTKERREIATFRVALATFIGLVAYVASNFWILRTMIAANQSATETFHITEQPFVALGNKHGAYAEFGQKDAKLAPVVILHFFNAGRSAAKHFQINVDTSIQPKGSGIVHLNRYRLDDGGRGPSLNFLRYSTVVIPAQANHLEYLTDALAPSAEQLGEIKTGKLPFLVDGTFEYCDEFQVFRCEQFHLKFEPAPVDDFVQLVGGEGCNGLLNKVAAQMSDPVSPDFFGYGTGWAKGRKIVPLLRCEE
jgi:hypothetical protein